MRILFLFFTCKIHILNYFVKILQKLDYHKPEQCIVQLKLLLIYILKGFYFWRFYQSVKVLLDITKMFVMLR